MTHEQFSQLWEKVAAVDAKLDRLLQALADEGDNEEPAVTLDGTPIGGERDQSQSL